MPSLSGQKTVTTAGTAVALGTQPINAPLIVKALGTNTGAIAVGNDGANDVSTSNGLLLGPGEEVSFEFVGHLASLFIDSENDGEGVSWLVLNM
jgi:hypothetical protein